MTKEGTPIEHEQFHADLTEQSETDGANQIIEDQFRARLGDTLKTFKEEISEPGFRIRRAGAAVLGTIAELSALSRVMIWTLPPTFERVLETSAEEGWNAYEQAAASGVTVGGVYAVWAAVAGKSFHISMKAFPETTGAVTENHPAMVGTIEKAISGFIDEEELAKKPQNEYGKYEVGPYDSRVSRWKKMALAPIRGLKTLFLFGTIPYVGISGTKDYSDKSINKLLAVTTTEASITVGGIAVALSTMMSHDLFGAAEEVKNIITNKYVLGAATGVVIGAAALDNHSKRQENVKKLVNEQGN